MDFLTLILAVTFGVMLGEFLAIMRFRKMLYKIAESHGIDLESEMDKVLSESDDEERIVADLKIEKMHDIFYLYHRLDDEFVCQGATIDEVAALAKKYKQINTATVVDIDNKELFVFNDGKVQLRKQVNESKNS